jgi:hypothetical protein
VSWFVGERDWDCFELLDYGQAWLGRVRVGGWRFDDDINNDRKSVLKKGVLSNAKALHCVRPGLTDI